jgi:hypothetical protein
VTSPHYRTHLRPARPRVCLLGDTDFSLTAYFHDWAQRVDFVFGMDCNTALRWRAEALTEADWTPLRWPAPGPTGQRRRHEPNHKRRTVAERGLRAQSRCVPRRPLSGRLARARIQTSGRPRACRVR